MDKKWINELVIDYGFDELPYTYCPLSGDQCDHDDCISEKQCRKQEASDHG